MLRSAIATFLVACFLMPFVVITTAALQVSPRSIVIFNNSNAKFTRKTYRAPPCFASADDGDDRGSVVLQSDLDQVILGTAGSAAAVLVLYSEFTLKTTGCGLPAGPAGLLGFTEGISYLSVVGFAAASLYRKLRTGSGLPAGPNGLLGAAEGLSFLAIVVGLVVLGFQIADYGYIPNAVPTEGGRCQ